MPVIPGTKRAAIRWKHWQNRRPPLALVKAWFSQRCRLALMCGTGGLLVLDFDNLDLYYRWQHIHQYYAAHSYQVNTSRPGVHVYFWCDELPEKSIKLADVDVKASGYVLAPPSEGYEIANGNSILRVATAESVVPGLVGNLLAVAERAENEGRVIGCQGQVGGQAANSPSPFSAIFGSCEDTTRLPPGIVWQIKQRLSILDLCNLYTPMKQTGNNGYHWGRCPSQNHHDRNPSFSCDLNTGRAHCWSGGCELHTNDGLDVIDLVGRLEGCGEKHAMMILAKYLGLEK